MNATDAYHEELAERIAGKVLARILPEIMAQRRAQEALAPDDKGGSEMAMKVLKKPNLAALKSFLARHQDCPRQKAGHRLVFSRSALREWMEKKSRKRS